ncbi:MAG: HpsJ family protein [Trichodesmium sp. MAG_R04]|nr:HpsJ family protein [Trichodesmium sp. MAG_R04]
MKATNIRQYSSIAARTLTIAGVVMILSSILDFIVLSIPSKIGNIYNTTWQISLTTQIVDRGIIPMVGMTLLFTGYWISNNSGLRDNSTSSILDLRFWALLLASLLGLVYLLLFPIHLNNIRIAKGERIEQIEQQSEQRETQLQNQIDSGQLETRVQEQLARQKKEFSNLLKDKTKLKEVLADEQLSDQIKNLLEESKDNPQVIEKFLKKRAEEVPNKSLTQIRIQEKQSKDQVDNIAFKSSFRTGLNSLLLSVGYIMIGWTGLKNMGIIKGKGRRQNLPR